MHPSTHPTAQPLNRPAARPRTAPRHSHRASQPSTQSTPQTIAQPPAQACTRHPLHSPQRIRSAAWTMTQPPHCTAPQRTDTAQPLATLSLTVYRIDIPADCATNYALDGDEQAGFSLQLTWLSSRCGAPLIVARPKNPTVVALLRTASVLATTIAHCRCHDRACSRAQLS